MSPDKTRVFELLSRGYSRRRISRELKMPISTVCDWARDMAQQRLAEESISEAQLRSVRERLRASEKVRQAQAEEIATLHTQLGFMQAARQPIELHPLKAGKSRQSAATAIICATDWHYEEEVSPDECNGLNRYDTKIAEQRLEQFWLSVAKLLKAQRALTNIEDAVLWLGGDLINGYIHVEFLETNQMAPLQALLAVKKAIRRGIAFLLEECDLSRLTVACNHGNHGRTTEKMRIATSAQNSYEWCLYQLLSEDYAQDTRVQFHIAGGYHLLLNVRGFMLRFHHGDGIRYQGGVGGLSVPLTKAIAQWNKAIPAHYDIFGHWHQFSRGWNYVSLGSLVGHNAFAIRCKCEYQPPTQGFLVIDSDRGMVTAEPVFVAGVDSCPPFGLRAK